MTYEQQVNYLEKLGAAVSDSESDSDNEHVQDSDDDWLPPSLPANNHKKDESDIEDVFLDSDKEIEVADEDENSDDDLSGVQACNEEQSLRSKDGSIWKSNPCVSSTQTLAHNVLRQKSGPVKATSSLSIRETFGRFFTTEMCYIVIRETNRKAKSVYAEWNNEHPNSTPKSWKNITPEEFDGYLGILVTTGVRHSKKENLRDLWKSDAYPLYRATMSINRFYAIQRFIRFDNVNTRPERLKTSKAAAISELWLLLMQNLRSNYTPSECLTVDEQLFPFRGRTRFTQYMPAKPAKYGIKIWWVCDAANSYPLSGQIYTGKTSQGREQNQGERVVKDLCVFYKNSGRNIVMDNFFTTLPLARFLMSWKLSVVGTLKKNKPYIPPEMLPNRNREEFSSVFGFSNDNVTIVSYVPKQGKAVILLSTMHNTIDITGPKKKPEVIHYYNSGKGGVDCMDKMLSHYSVKRKTNRWPLAMFYNMLDIAGLATFIVFAENDPLQEKKNYRRKFLQDLGKELAKSNIQNRAKSPRVWQHFSVKSGIECMLGAPLAHQTPTTNTNIQPRDKTGRLQVTGKCYVCRETEKKQRKTRKSCNACSRPVCNEHSENITKCHTCNL